MVAEHGHCNTYEEARKLRLEENKKRFEDLGILNISKSLSNLTTPEKKAKGRLPKPKSANTEVLEPRRSSRTRNAVASYSDDVGVDLPPLRKRYKSSSTSWASYIARPLEEVKLASYEDRTRALKAGEEFQSSLKSGNPSFVKSMLRSHVYSCFWLGLPTQFCKDHLPEKDLDMILEDEKGSAYDAKYLGNRTGLSGGWRGFALDHKLDDGDAVVFELVEPDKFKVYIFRISSLLSAHTHTADKEVPTEGKKPAPPSVKMQKSEKVKANKIEELPDTRKPQPQNGISDEGISENTDAIEKNGFVPEEEDKKGKSGRKKKVISADKEDKKGESGNKKDVILADKRDKKEGESVSKSKVSSDDHNDQQEEEEIISVGEKKKQEKRVSKPRKKPAPRFFRK